MSLAPQEGRWPYIACLRVADGNSVLRISGFYSPGYDVNRYVNDAWGVRDVIGSGFLGTSAYQGWMTKPRSEATRMFPPSPPPGMGCPRGAAESSLRDPDKRLGTYELRRASGISMADCQKPPPEAKDLAETMEAHSFGREKPTAQYKRDIDAQLADPLAATRRLVPSVALRYDRGLGGAFTLRGFDLRLVYLVPKFNFMTHGDMSFEALVTNAAARFYSPYLTMGVARESIAGDDHTWRFASEVGIKFRYRLSGWMRILSLGYHFAGFRAGLRYSGFDSVDNFRFVLEFGAGTW